MIKSVCIHNGTVLSGFAQMEKCAVFVEDGLVSDVFSQKRFQQRKFDSETLFYDANGAFIAPGFINTHIHGYGGFGTEDAFLCGEDIKTGINSILAMSESLVEQGVTAFNPTLYPSEPDLLIQAIEVISSCIGREKGARIMGLHLEGPFISPQRLGAQRAETVYPVDLNLMEIFWEKSGGHIKNMTVAPELKGMRELALFCIKKGIVLQAGHTNADYENMVEGMQAGILHSTHLFNAMRRLDHRNPNAVGAILIHPEMSCEIIADGFHVHPDLLKLLLRDKPINNIVLITDSLKPTVQKEGPFFANGEEVIFKDGIFRKVSDDTISGSGLTMINGIKNLVNNGFSVSEAVKTASKNPADIMHYKDIGTIMSGKQADITVFDRNFKVQMVMIGGKIVKGEAARRSQAL